MTTVLEEDLAAIFASLRPDWSSLAGARLFMTGGTGFIGQWMLEALYDADRKLGLNVTASILTRDPAAFATKAPHLASHPGFHFVSGDVLQLVPDGERYTHVLHAATDASADLNLNNPALMFDTVVIGTRRVLDFAIAAQARRFVFFSSGAVYGAQPWQVERVAEEWMGAPDTSKPANAYGEAKRSAEMLCAIYAKQFGIDVAIARIFALLGPLLPLDIHFAAGNFIRDALAGHTIEVQGAGNAVRSYLYAADLTVWLWTMLLKGPASCVYNLGSEESVSITELAQRTATLLGGPGVKVLGRPDPGWNPGRYVPSNHRIRRELGVTARIGLDEAIRRTALWQGWKGVEL